jgi:hypothetical protein
MRPSTRWLLVMVGTLAFVAASVAMIAEPAGPARATTMSNAPARIDIVEGHTAFIGQADIRTANRLASLVAWLGAVVLAAAGLVWLGASLGLGSASTSDRRRRWRALLVGAPPAIG